MLETTCAICNTQLHEDTPVEKLGSMIVHKACYSCMECQEQLDKENAYVCKDTKLLLCTKCKAKPLPEFCSFCTEICIKDFYKEDGQFYHKDCYIKYLDGDKPIDSVLSLSEEYSTGYSSVSSMEYRPQTEDDFKLQQSLEMLEKFYSEIPFEFEEDVNCDDFKNDQNETGITDDPKPFISKQLQLKQQFSSFNLLNTNEFIVNSEVITSMTKPSNIPKDPDVRSEEVLSEQNLYRVSQQLISQFLDSMLDFNDSQQVQEDAQNLHLSNQYPDVECLNSILEIKDQVNVQKIDQNPPVKVLNSIFEVQELKETKPKKESLHQNPAGQYPDSILNLELDQEVKQVEHNSNQQLAIMDFEPNQSNNNENQIVYSIEKASFVPANQKEDMQPNQVAEPKIIGQTNPNEQLSSKTNSNEDDVLDDLTQMINEAEIIVEEAPLEYMQQKQIQSSISKQAQTLNQAHLKILDQEEVKILDQQEVDVLHQQEIDYIHSQDQFQIHHQQLEIQHQMLIQQQQFQQQMQNQHQAQQQQLLLQEQQLQQQFQYYQQQPSPDTQFILQQQLYQQKQQQQSYFPQQLPNNFYYTPMYANNSSAVFQYPSNPCQTNLANNGNYLQQSLSTADYPTMKRAYDTPETQVKRQRHVSTPNDIVTQAMNENQIVYSAEKGIFEPAVQNPNHFQNASIINHVISQAQLNNNPIYYQPQPSTSQQNVFQVHKTMGQGSQTLSNSKNDTYSFVQSRQVAINPVDPNVDVYKQNLLKLVNQNAAPVERVLVQNRSSHNRENIPPPQPSPGPSNGTKQGRVQIKDQYKTYMEFYFKEEPFPDRYERARLGELLNLDQRQVQIWFQNQRSKTRRRAADATASGNVSAANQVTWARYNNPNSARNRVPTNNDVNPIN